MTETTTIDVSADVPVMVEDNKADVPIKAKPKDKTVFLPETVVESQNKTVEAPGEVVRYIVTYTGSPTRIENKFGVWFQGVSRSDLKGHQVERLGPDFTVTTEKVKE